LAFFVHNDQVKEDEMGRACSTTGVKRYVYRILVRKPEGKRPIGRPRRRWVESKKVKISLLQAVEAHRVARG
jgi:hypothetical protein